MKSQQVAQVIQDDGWGLAQGEVDTGAYILRFRRQVMSIADTTGYTRLLTILWPYAEEGSGALPSSDDLAAMEQFENRLCDALEHDNYAILTAVLTFDGARQWVVYTDDVHECAQRITDMPQNKEPYPIEMQARDDSGWDYLRQEVLHSID